MDSDTLVCLEALERTAAWVHQVSQIKNAEKPDPDEDISAGKDESLDQSRDDMDDNDLTDHMMFSNMSDQFIDSTYSEINIPQTVKEFKEVLEKSGISQRFAAKHIMEKTSQGNLSFLLEKGKTKRWAELSHRGRVPYVRMRRWLDSADEQRNTLSMLRQTKEYKKTGPKDGGGKREKFTLFQLMVLCRFYEEDNTPNLNTRSLLAEKLDVPLDRVTIWFQNQRARGFPAKKILSQANFTRKSVDMGFSPGTTGNQMPTLNSPVNSAFIGSPGLMNIAQDQSLTRLFETVGLNGANAAHLQQFHLTPRHIPPFLQMANQTRDSTGQSNSSSYPTSPANQIKTENTATEPCTSGPEHSLVQNKLETTNQSVFPQFNHRNSINMFPSATVKKESPVPFKSGNDEPLNFSKNHAMLSGKSPLHYSNESGADEDCIQ
ncbi:hypothetical protein FSP39_007821 [Pinctada imbricata]|uniref:One cut domain family member n=1 Tax=Pinctada imbricata TaxID=66713 RepID=A0AA89C6J4_PINIB|nr:hypothetical protein FSP39_007821 [Pinctada imbricata]